MPPAVAAGGPLAPARRSRKLRILFLLADGCRAEGGDAEAEGDQCDAGEDEKLDRLEESGFNGNLQSGRMSTPGAVGVACDDFQGVGAVGEVGEKGDATAAGVGPAVAEITEPIAKSETLRGDEGGSSEVDLERARICRNDDGG